MRIPLLVLPVLLFIACKREDNPQPTSNWKIGVDSFSTNQTTITRGKAIVLLNCTAAGSTFGYGNSVTSSLPNGMNKLDVTGTNNPAYLDVAFTKDSITYFPIDSSVVHTTHANGIVTMEMPLTQFRNYKDPTDIQLIKATIRVRSNY